jgi:hypothetical protein
MKHSSVKPQTLVVKNITSHNNLWMLRLLTITFRYLTEEWFILLWLVILLTITVEGLTEEWFILLWLLIVPLSNIKQ